MTTPSTELIDIADYASDPITVDLHALIRLIATWDNEVRDEVHETVGALAIVCGTRGSYHHRAAAEFLSLARHLIKSTSDRADEAKEASHGSA